jgi:tetratricopeptide (TPR) repeat protein
MSVIRSRRLVLIAAVAVTVGIGAVTGYVLWQRPHGLPEPGSPRYEEFDDAFQRGLAGLDADLPEVAEPSLTRAIELIPEEPATWANRGLFYVRHNQLDKAAQDLEKAHRLAPDDAGIEQLLGLLEQARGRFSEAAAHFRRAIEGNPQDIQAMYQLAKVVDQEQQEGTDAEFQRLMDQILAVQPNNLQVLLDKLNRAVRRSDRGAVQNALTQLKRLSQGWKVESRTALADCDRELAERLGPDAAFQAILLANLLKQEPAYGRDRALVDPDRLPGTPLMAFLRLTPAPRAPATADMDLTFLAEPLPGAPAGGCDCVLPVWLTGEGPPAVFVASAKEVRQLGAAWSLASPAASADGVLALDWNNDFRTDLLLAGRDGLLFYEQREDGTFADVTAKTGLPGEVLKGDYYGAWTHDVDLDGDLDIVLARRSGPPLLLRNNLDGTFTPLPIFTGANDVRAFAWVDLDGDGAPDVALLDARGRLGVFANERSGQFVPWPVPLPKDRFLALCVTDANDDGVLDLVALRDDGAVVRISDRNKRQSWDVAELVRWESLPRNAEPGTLRLVAADFDNNGAIDLLASGPEGTQIWLGEGNGEFRALKVALPPGLVAAVDLEGKGRLDLIGLTREGQPVRLRNTGQRDYHWQAFRCRARRHEMQQDRAQWMNSFAIGSEVEIRAGACVVKQPIAAPVVHFGLGTRARPSVIRAQWTTGRVNSFWDLPIDQVVVAEQRGYVSCPFLFTWNGERFVFVTDFMWSSPLGVPDGDQGQNNFALRTSDWVKIRGDQLVPRNGEYEIRTVANLWETHYYDRLSLQAVDHPVDAELFVDERASLDSTQLAFHLLESLRPLARAWDHNGDDVTAIVSAVDGNYLDRAGRGVYKGITNDHWVEIDLGDDIPQQGPVWLIATGWVMPVDSSTYFAIAQGRHEQPREPVLEIPDGPGGWKVVRENVGYPAGKNKTILIRLDGIDGPGVRRRFRLRTNMEIYWDAFQVARGRDDVPTKQYDLSAHYADLHLRGVLDLTRANSSSPELPNYDRVAHMGQPWRNLIGFHTRYGDVRELLEKTDDRYVIATAGDEMTLRFAVPPGPPPGWKRDFVWKCDGWTKDGDMNTRFGKTVLPLPARFLKSYSDPPGRLKDDPVYRLHVKDWELYHTRFVTPYDFERGLRNVHLPTTDAARR